MAILTPVTVSSFDLTLKKQVGTQDLVVLEANASTLLTQAEQRAQSMREKTLALYEQSAAESAAHIAARVSENEDLRGQITVLQTGNDALRARQAAEKAILKEKIAILRTQNAELRRQQTEAVAKIDAEKAAIGQRHEQEMAALKASSNAREQQMRSELVKVNADLAPARLELATIRSVVKNDRIQLGVTNARINEIQTEMEKTEAALSASMHQEHELEATMHRRKVPYRGTLPPWKTQS